MPIFFKFDFLRPEILYFLIVFRNYIGQNLSVFYQFVFIMWRQFKHSVYIQASLVGILIF